MKLLFWICTAALAADYKDIVFTAAGGETLKLDAHVPDGPGP